MVGFEVVDGSVGLEVELVIAIEIQHRTGATSPTEQRKAK